MSNKKTPELRFYGFTEDWEEREVSKMLEERNLQTPKSLEYPLMAFIANRGGSSKGDRYDRESLVTNSEHKKYKQTEYGDFIYSSNNLETGSIGVNLHGNATISPVYSIFKPTEGANPHFLGDLLKRKSFINKMITTRQGVMYGQWRIHESDFIKLTNKVPDVIEQTKIGEYFKTLDNLIICHQRKHDQLQVVKKSMLEKMFPQKGAKVPEIRFDGFTDEWEERELGELLQNRRVLAKQSNELSRLAFASGQGVIPLSERKSNNRDQLIEDEYSKNYLITDYNDIVYNPANLKYGAIDRNKFGKGLISPIYVTFTTNEVPQFMEKIVTTEKFKNRALLFEEGTVVKRQMVSPTNLLSLNVMITTHKEEQTLIGEYFFTLDKLITTHQRELDKLKNIKKSMLEKMFV